MTKLRSDPIDAAVAFAQAVNSLPFDRVTETAGIDRAAKLLGIPKGSLTKMMVPHSPGTQRRTIDIRDAELIDRALEMGKVPPVNFHAWQARRKRFLDGVLEPQLYDPAAFLEHALAWVQEATRAIRAGRGDQIQTRKLVAALHTCLGEASQAAVEIDEQRARRARATTSALRVVSETG